MFTTVLFDFDGTVFDTGEGITKSVQYALKKQGIEADISELGYFVGPPLFDSFKNGFNMTDEQAAQAVVDYRERYKPIGLYECRIYDGIDELLKELKAMGCKLGIATAKPLHMAETLLKYGNVYDYFDVYCGSPENVHGRTKPEIITEALEKLGVTDKDSAIMIGDTKFDILGAHDVGIKAIGVSYGYGSKEELETAKADYIVASVPEILNIIK